ncbi:MAG: hypothetical protein ACOYCB_05735 [Fastidiosipilaceae bacterium]|nr:YwqI/YxiC family protein [Clostridiaceae bacterium]
MGQIQINPGTLKGLIGNMTSTMNGFDSAASSIDVSFSENKLAFTDELESRLNSLKSELTNMSTSTIASYNHMSNSVDEMTEVDRNILF